MNYLLDLACEQFCKVLEEFAREYYLFIYFRGNIIISYDFNNKNKISIN